MFANILLALTMDLSLPVLFANGEENVWPFKWKITKKIPLDPALAWQSSTYTESYALSTNEANGAVKSFCSREKKIYWTASTNKEKYPGWAIDLGELHYVESIVVKTRMFKKLPKILENLAFSEYKKVYAFVWVKKVRLNDRMQFSKSCSHFRGPTDHEHQKIKFPCKKKGRFAGIVLKQANQWLGFCHVTIYGISVKQVIADGIWSAWSPWTECSKSCGAGEKSQTRTCEVKKCKGDYTKKIEKCLIKYCPGWSTWNSWGNCTVLCGGGTRSHARICRGDSVCQGNDSEEKPCNTHKCSDDDVKLAKMSGKWAYVTGAVVGSLLFIGLIAAAIIIGRRK